jgi:hypothetical protein
VSFRAQAGGGIVPPGPVHETVVPVQMPPRKKATPEQRLLLAVLDEAISTYRRHVGARSGRGRALFANAQAWFSSDDTGWLFAFESICDALQVDVSGVRSQLARWRQGDAVVVERRPRRAAVSGPAGRSP